MEIQEIPNNDYVARLTIYPHMFSDNKFLWEGGGLFLFPSKDEHCDSVVWRKYADDSYVHELGQLKVKDHITQKYRGFLNGKIEKIREIETERHCKCEVNHDPSNGQGIHHAVIKIIKPYDNKLRPNDRQDVINALEGVFNDWKPFLVI